MVDKGSVVDRGLVENGDMVDTVGNMVGDGRAMETIMMEGGMVNSMGANSIIDSMSNRKAIFEGRHGILIFSCLLFVLFET